MLEAGHAVRFSQQGVTARVGRLLGEGGEGAVFGVDVAGRPHALKWYHAHRAISTRRAELEALIARGRPHPRFLWPLDIATSDDDRGFGYLMDLRPADYVGCAELVSGRAEASLLATARVGFELADSFLHIHSLGLCYRDINFGNVFVQPQTGAVLVCDNDNVGIDGLAGSVLGVPYFMAPEVLREEVLPNRRTDLYSLAVLLFYVLMAGHPLEGRRTDEYPCWDDETRLDMFGRRPLFVFDPVDRSNALDPEYQAATIALWDLYPTFVKQRFVEAFTVGLVDPDARVLESVWRKTMVRLAANVCYCGACGAQNFADSGPRCWSCQATIATPPKLVVHGLRVMLNHDTVVRSYVVDLDYNRDEPFAEMAENPTTPGLWGLRNVSSGTWVVIHPTGGRREVAPGRAIALAEGMVLELGPATATLEA